MNTPAHLAASVLVFRNQSGWGAASAVAVGAILPDAPMFGFYAYQKLFAGRSEGEIWSTLYFQEDWQYLFDVFNSAPRRRPSALSALSNLAIREPRFLLGRGTFRPHLYVVRTSLHRGSMCLRGLERPTPAHARARAGDARRLCGVHRVRAHRLAARSGEPGMSVSVQALLCANCDGLVCQFRRFAIVDEGSIASRRRTLQSGFGAA